MPLPIIPSTIISASKPRITLTSDRRIHAGFRALKVWLALQQVGRSGYEQMISDDIRLARALFERIPQYPELEALTHSLSITTFRYVPADLEPATRRWRSYLDELNLELLNPPAE